MGKIGQGYVCSPREMALDTYKSVLAQREEILRAFVAKYNCQPDEIVQIEEKTENGMRWYLGYKPKEE